MAIQNEISYIYPHFVLFPGSNIIHTGDYIYSLQLHEISIALSRGIRWKQKLSNGLYQRLGVWFHYRNLWIGIQHIHTMRLQYIRGRPLCWLPCGRGVHSPVSELKQVVWNRPWPKDVANDSQILIDIGLKTRTRDDTNIVCTSHISAKGLFEKLYFLEKLFRFS